MNEMLIKEIKKELKYTETTGDYEKLYPYAYSDSFVIRYIFMRLLIAYNHNLNISKLYDDNITNYFNKYDNDGNIIDLMPYKLIKSLGDVAMHKDDTIYKQIITYIVDNYIKKPEEFKKGISI